MHKRAFIAGVALAAVAVASTAADARSTRTNSFDGICHLTGEFQFPTPIGGGRIVTTTLTDTASGTCSGKLNGVQRDDIPTTNTVTGTATLVGCQLGTSSTSDTLTFAGKRKLHIFTDAVFAPPEGAGHFRGAVSGGGVVEVNLLPYTDQATLEACQAGTLSSARYDLVARTVTPMVG